jgi:hypothetical protein
MHGPLGKMCRKESWRFTGEGSFGERPDGVTLSGLA